MEDLLIMTRFLSNTKYQFHIMKYHLINRTTNIIKQKLFKKY